MMRRRRRRTREIAFGLDAFLDVITNVIGIIIRMILVVWISARAYHAAQSQVPSVAKPLSLPPLKQKKLTDPLEKTIAQHQQQLATAKQQLLLQLRQLPSLKNTNQNLDRQLTQVAATKQSLQNQQDQLNTKLKAAHSKHQQITITRNELQQRQYNLQAKINALAKSPNASTKTITYRAPVSRAVKTDKLYFECKNGRVTFIDLNNFVDELKDNISLNNERLKNNGTVLGITAPSGAFRLRYLVRAQNPALATLFNEPALDYRLRVEPIAAKRGETATAALAPHSQFRRHVDFADPRRTAIVMWVYPDSFALFRQLRDYLYDRDLEVAANPLPDGVPIGLSPNGNKSWGQ